MSLLRRTLLATGAAAGLARPALVRAQSSKPFRIGEINSYATDPGFTQSYRKGWEMALSRLNDLGGLDGRKVEFLARDDGGTAEGAVRAAAGLVGEDKVELLAGGCSSETGLAISAWALQNKKAYIAALPLSDDLVWAKGNRVTYSIRPSTFMQAAMLVDTAFTLPAKAYVTVGPDTIYGRSAVKRFRDLLTGKRQDVRFTAEQWPAAGRMDAASVVGALSQAAPDAIFCALTGRDLQAFVREGTSHGLFESRLVVAMLAGDPENLALLAGDTPVGWLVTGFPWSLSDQPDNKQFTLDYTGRYNEPPTMGAALGVALVNAISSGVLKAGGAEGEKLADGFADATFNSPFGICRLRAVDHQSTMGTYVGRLTKQGNRGGMVDWRYVEGSTVLPRDDLVRQMRPA